MKSFKPVANSFKKKSKPSRPVRVHGVAEPLLDDGLLAKKHAGGLRSPKASSGRSPVAKPRPGRVPLHGVKTATPRTPSHTARTVDDASRPAVRPTSASTKKRSRPGSRPVDGAAPGCAGASIVEGRQSGASGNDAVKVFVRIRPPAATDDLGADGEPRFRQLNEESVSVHGTSDTTQFSYDYVAGPSVKQRKLFNVTGVPVVDNCLRGYNSCVFAYGQTGSGKTYTMLGNLPARVGALSLPPSSGLMPRIFQYLFSQIAEKQEKDPRVRYACSCSLLEIYNETITDLLNPGSTNLQLRTGISGVYAEDVTVERIQDAQHAVDMLRRGSANRRVAGTNMNSDSSRSHCVLTCMIESKTTDASGGTTVVTSRLNLVDLAGSERQKSSGASGGRLREASSINRSLSTLGLVINSLADVQNGRRGRHVPYRDSKLTFLLQDSLGGNSKTVMIANVNPAKANLHETISTLRFARRAKFVKNKPVLNQGQKMDPSALKQKIARLNQDAARRRVICEAALNNVYVSSDGDVAMESASNPPAEVQPSSFPSLKIMQPRTAGAGAPQRAADTEMDVEMRQPRAQETASKPVSITSRRAEEVIAKAHREVRRRVSQKPAVHSSSVRDLRAQLEAKSKAQREESTKLMAMLDCNKQLQARLRQLEEIVSQLTKEKSILESKLAKEQSLIKEAGAHAKVAVQDALDNVTRAQEEVARLTAEKDNVEAQLRAAADAKEEIELQCMELGNDLRCTHQQLVVAVENNKNLHLENKQLEEQVMDLVAEKEDLLSKVKLLADSQQDRVCSEDEDGPCCTCGIEIVRLQGQLEEEKEKTYYLVRQLEILTLQQDSEFREEFGSCKDQLVTLLKKLEEATTELNHLKHVVIERDSEVRDLQEYVVSFDDHCGHLEDELRAHVLEREDLLSENKRLEAELALLRQENSRLSKGTEGRDSEMASLRRELAYLRAVASMHTVSEAKPLCMGSPLSDQEGGFTEQLDGSNPLKVVEEWEVEQEYQRTMAAAQGCHVVAPPGDAGNMFLDEMDVDVLDAEPLGIHRPHGDNLINHSRLEVACL